MTSTTRATTTAVLPRISIPTPYIINEPDELPRIFERKTRERRKFIEAYAQLQR